MEKNETLFMNYKFSREIKFFDVTKGERKRIFKNERRFLHNSNTYLIAKIASGYKTLTFECYLLTIAVLKFTLKNIGSLWKVYVFRFNDIFLDYIILSFL
jgi:hypothetical protein